MNGNYAKHIGSTTHEAGALLLERARKAVAERD